MEEFKSRRALGPRYAIRATQTDNFVITCMNTLVNIAFIRHFLAFVGFCI